MILKIAENMLTGEIPKFLEKSESSEDVDMLGDCYPNILSNFIPKIRRKNGQKKLTEVQLSTLSLCKYVRPIYVLIFFVECFNKFRV